MENRWVELIHGYQDHSMNCIANFNSCIPISQNGMLQNYIRTPYHIQSWWCTVFMFVYDDDSETNEISNATEFLRILNQDNY